MACPCCPGAARPARSLRAALPARSRREFHQPCRRARTAHGEGQDQGLGLLSNHSLRRGLCPQLRLPAVHGRARLQPSRRHSNRARRAGCRHALSTLWPDPHSRRLRWCSEWQVDTQLCPLGPLGRRLPVRTVSGPRQDCHTNNHAQGGRRPAQALTRATLGEQTSSRRGRVVTVDLDEPAPTCMLESSSLVQNRHSEWQPDSAIARRTQSETARAPP